MLAIHSKSFFARPNEILSIDLTINLKNLIALFVFGNKIYLYFFMCYCWNKTSLEKNRYIKTLYKHILAKIKC